MRNLRHQIKSQWYYIFWGSMAIAVVGGQIYVGSGYREMAKATREHRIIVECTPEYQTPLAPTTKLNNPGEFE